MQQITKDIAEGHAFSGKPRSLTLERLQFFSGGYPQGPDWPARNIHTDLEVAGQCGLPTRAASGAMFQGYLTDLMIDLFGIDWLRGGKMSLTFINLADAGDTLTPKAVVRSKEAKATQIDFTLEIWCENQHGTKVVVGDAQGIVHNI